MGHWAAPDCANTQEALSFTRYFYLKSAPHRLELNRYTLRGTGADHVILSLGDVTTVVMRQEDGVLRTGIPTENTTTIEWDQLTLDQPLDYTNCPQTPDVIPKSLQRVLRYIDRINDACAITRNASITAPRHLSQDCARVIFKAMDDNSDNALSLVEVKLGLASAALLASLAEHHVLDNDGIEAATLQAKNIAALAGDLMQDQDKNGDGKLDYNEAVAPIEKTDMSPLKSVLSAIGNFFTAFKLAAMKL